MSNLETSLIINLAGNLVQRADRYSRALGDMSHRGSRHMAALNRSVVATSNRIDQLGNRAALATVAGAYGFERTFVRTAAQFERYEIMLQQLQGSQKAGADALQWITDFTINTPFQLDGVTAAFVKMRAFGLDPMDGSMQAIADSTAKMGGGQQELEGIILALGQAWQKGKLQGEEALQLLERGIPVWDLLAGATGRSTAELQKLSSQGYLTRDVISLLIREMGKSSEGAAVAQMKTWNGMMSNMGDQWTVFQKQVMDSGAFDYLKGEMRDLLALLNEMQASGELAEKAQNLSDELIEGFKSAKDVGQDLYQVLQGIGSVVSEVADLTGGYANLGKILASIYLINKAMRFGAPIAGAGFKAGSYLLNRGKGGIPGAAGGGLLGAASSMAPVPVYVVNPPSIPGVGGKGGKGGLFKRFSGLKTTAGLVGGTNLSKLSMLGVAGLGTAGAGVAAAGATGYGVGTLINEWYGLLDRKLDWRIRATLADTLGKGMAHTAAAFGSEEAQAALDAEQRAQEAMDAEKPAQASLKVSIEDNRVNVTQLEATGVEVDISGQSMRGVW